jgi:hypothetical protein
MKLVFSCWIGDLSSARVAGGGLREEKRPSW